MCVDLKELYESAAPQVVRQAAYSHFYPSWQSLQLSPSREPQPTPTNTHTRQHVISSHQRRCPLSTAGSFHASQKQLQTFSQKMTDL